MDEKDLITGQLIFFSSEEVHFLAETVRALWNDGAAERSKSSSSRSPADIAETVKKAQGARHHAGHRPLWPHGHSRPRSSTSRPPCRSRTTVSTHALDLESDYFTAVDDLLTGQDETGAGMIGDIDFDSCCYYQYASLDMDKLRENLKDSARGARPRGRMLPVLLRVMALSNPGGKQNSFAGHVRSRRDAGRVQAGEDPPQLRQRLRKAPSPAIPRRSSRTAPTGWRRRSTTDGRLLRAARRASRLDGASLGDRAVRLRALRQLCGTPRRLRGLGQGVTAMKLLILRLEGALQSWGERSHWDHRDTAVFPSKSGVVGLLGCAMGLERGDARLAELADAACLCRARRPPRHGDDGLSYRAEPSRQVFEHAGQAARRLPSLPRGNIWKTPASRRSSPARRTCCLPARTRCAAPYGCPVWGAGAARPPVRCCPCLTDAYDSLEDAARRFRWKDMENARTEKDLYCEIEDALGMRTRSDQPLDASRDRYTPRRVRLLYETGGYPCS